MKGSSRHAPALSSRQVDGARARSKRTRRDKRDRKEKKEKKEKKSKRRKKGKKSKKRARSLSRSRSRSPPPPDREARPGLLRTLGTGRIITSGTTVMGREGTQFQQELSPGDCVEVQHPTSLVRETRAVTMVLSDVSISLSSAFSSDLVSAVPFICLRTPPEPSRPGAEREAREAKRRRAADDEREAFGVYAGGGDGTHFTFRAKKAGAYGGYETITTRVTGRGLSREQLLDLRASKKGDRHC